MAGYLDFIKTKHLINAIKNESCGFRTGFPKLMKLLIDATCGDGASSRIPVGDDITDPGYDGIVDNSVKNSFVPDGLSVWEFGTEEDVKRKIEEDYKKRIHNSCGVDKNDAVLCLCTPRKWPSRRETIEEWKNAHTGWKDVRIYDAQVIADWLNKTPSVCIWFLEQFVKEENINVTTLDFAWEELANRTNPALDESFFDLDEKMSLEIKNNAAIVVCAEDKIDSYGFVLRFLRLSGRKNVIVLHDANMLEKIQNVAVGQIIVCDFDVETITARNNNCIIRCCSMMDKTVGNVILPKRDYAKTNNALVRSGIDATRASCICQATHLKTYAILRKIKSSAYAELYKWNKFGEDNLLKAMLCVQKCMSNVEKDALSIISGLGIVDLENRMEKLVRMNDAPIIKRGNAFALAVPEEVACAFIDDGNAVFIRRAHNVFKEVLGSVANEEQWSGHNYYECEVLLSGLATFYVYVSEYIDKGDAFSLSERVNELINHPAILKNKMVQGAIVPHFCEADPGLLMDYLERNVDKIIDTTIDRSVFIASIELLLESEYVERACLLARRVYSATIDKEVLELLCVALHPFKNHYMFSIEKKSEMAARLIGSHSEDASLFIEQLFKNNGFFLADRVIRRSIDENNNISITYSQYYNYHETVINACVSIEDEKLYYCIIKTILEHLNCFSLNYLENIMKRFRYDAFSYQELAKIQLVIIEQESFYKKHHADLSKLLDKWLKITAYEPVFEHLWLFGSYYNYVNYYYDDMPFDKKKCHTEKERQRFFRSLRKNKPKEYIEIISCILKDEYDWGTFIFRNDQRNIKEWTIKLNEHKKASAIAGILDNVSKESTKLLFGVIDNETKLLVIERMNNSNVCSLITENEKEFFWKNKEMRVFSEDAYRNILRYNPEGLIQYLFANNDVERGCVIEILKAINKLPVHDNIRFNNIDDYSYTQILNRYTDELNDDLDKEVFELFVGGRLHYSVLQSNRFAFKHLDSIKETIKKRDRFFSGDLFGLRIPNYICTDIKQLDFVWGYIKKMDESDDIFASVIINTLCLEDDDAVRRALLEYVNDHAEQELLDRIKLKLDMLMTNGFFYNASRRDFSIEKLLNISHGLSNIQEIINDAANNNARENEWFKNICEDTSLVHDRMGIIK